MIVAGQKHKTVRIAHPTNWVEEGREPEGLVASKLDPATGAVLLSRPLCEYPSYPRYRSGSPVEAASFDCVGSDTAEADVSDDSCE